MCSDLRTVEPIPDSGKHAEGCTESPDLGGITHVDFFRCQRFDTQMFAIPQILAKVTRLSLYGLDWIDDAGEQHCSEVIEVRESTPWKTSSYS